LFFLDPEHDVAEHRHEAAVGVVRKAVVAGQLGQARDGLVVEAEVEDRVHHPGHRDARTAAHRDQERVRGPAELLSGLRFETLHRGANLMGQPVRQPAAGIVIRQARLGRDGEARRHRQAGAGHLG
jgi:hypothetical protein